MAKQKNLYLIKDRDLPIGIISDREQAEAVHRVSLGMYHYRPISEGEASLLRPNIGDYYASEQLA